MVESWFEHRDRLLFRDWLIEHPVVALEYGKLKMSVWPVCKLKISLEHWG
jgi:GrpB-like predicted nucleotidyltransferase (UPF0157 family)